MDPLHHRLLAALGRTHRAGHGGQRRRGHPARHLLVAGRGDLDLHVDRRDVRPQADPLHRPPQPPATIDAEAHPHGRAAYRGEVAFAVLQGVARRPGAAALVGQDVAHGAVARRAHAGSARDHRQHDLRHRRGDPLAARNFEQPFAAGAQRFSDWRAASRTSSRAAPRCTACASASRPTCARNGSTPTSR